MVDVCGFMANSGVVGWCGVVYLMSPDFQLILAYSWARTAILIAGKGRGGMFLFFLFLHFHSCSSFFPVSLLHLLYYLFYLFYYLFSPFLWETTQNGPQGLHVVKPQHNKKNHGKFCIIMNRLWPFCAFGIFPAFEPVDQERCFSCTDRIIEVSVIWVVKLQTHHLLQDHSHTPWLIILYKYLQIWKSQVNFWIELY